MAAGASKATITRHRRRLRARYPGKAIRVLHASNGEVAIFPVCPQCNKPRWLCAHDEQWPKEN